MTPQLGFAKELACIHPRYFAVWDDTIKRWRIRRWLGNHNKWTPWESFSDNVKTICMEDEFGQDIGYAPLDQRTLDALREGLYWARHARKLFQMVDEANARRYANADIENEYIHRYGAKQIWRHFREPMVDLGGANVFNQRQCNCFS